MNDLGKILVLIGLIFVVVGLVLWSGFGKSWLGRLPGDVKYQHPGFSFHFPVVTCLLVSAIVSFCLWLFRK